MQAPFLRAIKTIKLYLLDLFILIVVGGCAWLGYKQGFICCLSRLLNWTGTVIIALTLAGDTQQLIKQNFVINEQSLLPVTLITLFACSYLLLYLLLYYLQKFIPVSFKESTGNHVAGLLPGFITGLMVAMLVASIVNASLWSQADKKVQQTVLASKLIALPGYLGYDIAKLNRSTAPIVIAGAAEFTTGNAGAAFKCVHFFPRHDLEQTLLQLVNMERAKQHAKPLLPDTPLQDIARLHAADMFVRGYFSHDTPEGMDPFERMDRAGIHYLAAGENLAHSPTIIKAHDGLMQSPGHRANILNPRFARIGIAVLDGGEKGLMVVQEFKN